MEKTKVMVDCRYCGGDGWADGMEELNRNPARRGDTTCLACNGTGKEEADRA